MGVRDGFVKMTVRLAWLRIGPKEGSFIDKAMELWTL
jgi:hypothetical protein